MNRLERKVKRALAKKAPLSAVPTRDWEDVLVRAGEEPVPERRRPLSWRPKRSLVTKRLAPVLALAAAIFAVVLFSPWQGGPGSSVTQRALAAIDKGPVLHVVVHDEANSYNGFIDLSSGRETRAVNTTEFWYDRKRDFEIINEGHEVNGTFLVGMRTLITPKGTWSTRDWYEWGPLQDSVVPPQLSGFLDDYHSALADGSAHVVGSGTLNGHDVTWIQWPSLPGHCDNSGPEGIPPGYTCDARVSVDESNSLPVQIAWVHGNKVLATVEIASVEALPAGSGDFRKPKQAPHETFNPPTRISPTDAGGAAEELPGALWAGKSLGSLELTGALRASVGSIGRGGPAGQSTEPGIQLHYGSGNSAFLWSSGVPDPYMHGTGVVIEERKADPEFFIPPVPGLTPPAGSVLAWWYGRVGWMKKDGLVIWIYATSKDLMLEAARVLEPIKP
jgi:hypothetical protein